MADPECVTSNACGNNEICVNCACVPVEGECPDPGAANCNTNEDCPSFSACIDCVCIADCESMEDGECINDADCGDGGMCDLQSCTCLGGDPGGSSTGSPPLEGETDPEDDCENDEGTAACVPTMDITLVASDCVKGDATVRVQTAAGMINDAPADYDTIEVFFEPDDDGETHWVRAYGQGGAYVCDYRIGAAYMPLGPADICELNAADGTFDFTLSSATSGVTFDEFSVQSHLSSPYLIDTAGPFPIDC